MIKLVLRRDDPDAFVQGWRSFLSANTGSPRYVLEYVDYMLAYAPMLVEDLSFVYFRDNRSAAIAFLPIEQQPDGRRTVSLQGGFSLAPLLGDLRHESDVFDSLDRLAQSVGVGKIALYVDPLISWVHQPYNPLRRYGYIDASATDFICDLTIPENERRRLLAEEHRRNLKKFDQDPRYELVRVDAANPRWELHEAYRNLHRKCAGRETRPGSTFDKQYELLRRDGATLFGLRFEGRFVCFLYFLHHGNTVFYMSGADDPDYIGKPTYHPILWAASCFYASRGFRWLQLTQPAGFSAVSGFLDALDKKQLNISRFKRHFGATAVPFWRGVRYFDAALFEADVEVFRNDVLRSLKKSLEDQQPHATAPDGCAVS